MQKTLTMYQKRYGKAAAVLLKRRRLPWVVAMTNIRQRCCNPKDPKYHCYGGRGVLCQVTAAQLKAAYFRARAWRLKMPSVDRIKNGNYSNGNIRWIEMAANRARPRTPKTY